MNYRVIKTVKRTITKEFATLRDLDDWAHKNTYKQGTVTLFVGEVQVLEGSHWDLTQHTTSAYLAELDKKGA